MIYSYYDSTEHYFTSNSVSNNIGHKKYDFIFSVGNNDFTASMIVRQTAAGSWYHGGMGVCIEGLKADTTTDRGNGNWLDVVGSNYGGNNGAHYIRTVGHPNNRSQVMEFNREYLLEMKRTGNTYESQVTDLTTNEIKQTGTYTYTGTDNYTIVCFGAFEGCTFYYKDIKIKIL